MATPIVKPSTTLSLNFVQNGTVELQYVPSSIEIEEEASHQTLKTLTDKVTFIAVEGTQIRTLNISCYFTALTPAVNNPAILQQGVLTNTRSG